MQHSSPFTPHLIILSKICIAQRHVADYHRLASSMHTYPTLNYVILCDFITFYFIIVLGNTHLHKSTYFDAIPTLIVHESTSFYIIGRYGYY